MFKKLRHILWYKEINKDDSPLVGGKNASLGEMFKNLTKQGVNLPDGFCLTSKSFWYFLKENKIDKQIKELFNNFDKNSLASLRKTGREARALILNSEFPGDLDRKIIKSYRKLSKKYKTKDADVAVRSSATAEDLATASFAGQMETFLNIREEEELLKAVKKCIASLFTDRSIAYREEKGFDHLKIALSVGVQKMVRSDLSASGVMFTLDTESGFENVVLINSIWGIGEMIVQGKITPDEFYVFKPTKAVIVKNLGRKDRKFIYAKKGGLKEVKVKERDQFKFSLTEKEALTLADWAMKIQNHYGSHQDIEWAKDGKTKELFIVQARPETVHAPQIGKKYVEYNIKTKESPILEGIAIGNKIGAGKVRVINNISKIEEFKESEILVTKMTDPDWVPIMRMASAIVTDEGGKTCFEGDTRILTNKGFIDIKDIVKCSKTEKLYTPSLNRETLKLEWKRIIRGFSRKSSLIKIETSQTGRMENNYLEVTPDHKFLNFSNRELVSEEISKIIKNKENILSIAGIPQPNLIKPYNEPSFDLAYLQGAIITDGHIVFKKYSGKLKSQLFFIQKITPKKERFIKRVKKCFYQEYGYNMHLLPKKAGGGVIKGRRIIGSKDCISLKCYKHDIIRDFLEKQKNISKILLDAKREFVLNFLAGVIDGDGTYNQESNRVNIFCFKKNLLDAITIACLRLNINFQVSKNRNIWNVQIVDGIEEIFKYTARVKGKYNRKRFGVKFLSAKQLLGDIIERVNYRGRVLSYVKNNLLIDVKKIKNHIIPMIKGEPENHALTKIIDSPLKSLRVSSNHYLKKGDVYNIEVEDNHNYIVFTKRNTPILVENCHAAIVARELNVPSIVGTKNATKVLKTGQEVTVDCTKGMHGRIFNKIVPYETKEYNLKKIPKIKTKIMLNIGDPKTAFTSSFLPVKGVGLAREEFIITEKIKIHPLALVNFDKLKDKSLKKKINEITVEHKDKKEFFVKELAEGIAQIAAAFYPREAIVRFSDFKTNEYRNLIGGELYERDENNPMMGFRGAARYLDESFQPAFRLECQAIKRVRETFKLNNVSVMVPFCRTIEEGERVKKLIGKFGLKDVKIYVMAEVPSNVILANEFLKIFDGMSIGSNDLTQLTLGLDRDNGNIAYIGDETNEAVKRSISKVIQACKAKKKYCGICGDAPSSIPGFVKFLKDNEIPSMSLSSDVVIKTIMNLSKK